MPIHTKSNDVVVVKIEEEDKTILNPNTKNSASVVPRPPQRSLFIRLFGLRALWRYLRVAVYSFFLAILQEMKLLPFLVFYYTRYRKDLVLTPELLEILRGKMGENEELDSGNPSDKPKEKVFNKKLESLKLWTHIKPNFVDSLLNDGFRQDVAEKGGLMKSVLKAMPQAILQYINNTLLDEWSVIAIISFAMSVFTIIVNLVQLYGDIYNSMWRDYETVQREIKLKDKYSIGGSL